MRSSPAHRAPHVFSNTDMTRVVLITTTNIGYDYEQHYHIKIYSSIVATASAGYYDRQCSVSCRLTVGAVAACVRASVEAATPSPFPGVKTWEPQRLYGKVYWLRLSSRFSYAIKFGRASYSAHIRCVHVCTKGD